MTGFEKFATTITLVGCCGDGSGLSVADPALRWPLLIENQVQGATRCQYPAGIKVVFAKAVGIHTGQVMQYLINRCCSCSCCRRCYRWLIRLFMRMMYVADFSAADVTVVAFNKGRKNRGWYPVGCVPYYYAESHGCRVAARSRGDFY